MSGSEFGEITDTWNPITGCLHGCVYCVTGDTLVLTTNFAWKPIKDIEVGEEIIGFTEEEVGGYRYFVKSRVILKIKRRKKKKVFLIKGEHSHVKASEDHIWLVKRGGGKEGSNNVWRKTYQVERWRYPIKFLFKPEEQPKLTEDYMRGYVAGIFIGDGTWDFYKNKRSYFIRIAMKDLEAPMRTFEFLKALGLSKEKSEIRTYKVKTSDLFKIESWSKKIYDMILDIIENRGNSVDFAKGFLSGIYDAEGSYSSVLRISNYDESVIKDVEMYGKFLGFSFVEEERGVRLLGGLNEVIRFFIITNPIVKRKKEKILNKPLKNAIDEKVEIEKYGEEYVYDITTTSGTFIANGFLTHNCWARKYAERLASMGVEPYRTHIFEPAFADWRLRQRFRDGGTVFVSDMGDMWGDWVPGGWINRVLEVVRSRPRTRFFFLTKNPKRYLEYEDRLSENVVLGATIETNRDYGLTRAPTPRERYEAMARLSWPHKVVVVEPILDFDGELLDWICEISPMMVYVGYDNHGNNLPEPKMAKTQILLEALKDLTDLRVKTIRKAWHET